MDNKIVDLQQVRTNKEKPTIIDLISSMAAHNCDTNRPYTEQQPKRAAMEIKGLSRRDICDCMVLGILECKPESVNKNLPHIYVSKKGTLFKNFNDLEKSKEGYKDSYLDPELATYNDLYGWNLDGIDPIAAVQNMACYLERKIGIFPALIDFKK